MRIVWAFRPENNSIVVAALIFENAGYVILPFPNPNHGISVLTNNQSCCPLRCKRSFHPTNPPRYPSKYWLEPYRFESFPCDFDIRPYDHLLEYHLSHYKFFHSQPSLHSNNEEPPLIRFMLDTLSLALPSNLRHFSYRYSIFYSR